jgi:hypothetical protein
MLPLAAIVTIVVMAVATVGLIIWDIIVATNNIPNNVDTISGRMKIWGKKALLLPWAWAVLYGHFFGPIRGGQLMSSKVSVPILIFISWVVVLAGIELRARGLSITNWPIFFIILNLGALAGAFLWPQIK